MVVSAWTTQTSLIRADIIPRFKSICIMPMYPESHNKSSKYLVPKGLKFLPIPDLLPAYPSAVEELQSSE